MLSIKRKNLPPILVLLVVDSSSLFFVAMSDVDDEEENRCVQLQVKFCERLNKTKIKNMNIHSFSTSIERKGKERKR